MGKTGKAAKGGMSSGCMILFALPFAGVGVFMAWLTFSAWAKGNAARKWVEVPAKVLSAKLERHSDSDGGTTYKAVAAYEYQFDGAMLRGDRVSFHGGADNIGSFQKEKGRELEKYARSGEMFRCFVDPEEPSQSVLYRDLRWGMMAFYAMFAVVFGGVGFGMITWALVGRKKAKAEEGLAQSRPDEPWLWREDWAKGMVECASGRFALPLIASAVFVNAIAWPVLMLAIWPELTEKGNKAALLGLLFPLLGIVLIALALRSLARRRKFGATRFEMASVPGVVGGRLAGVVHVPNHIRAGSGFRQTLRCIRREIVRSGKSSSIRETALWENERHLASELLPQDNTRTAIPVLFGIPFEQPESTPGHSQVGIVWRLEVEAEVPGVDFEARYDVPVFKTAESSPDFQLDESPIAGLVDAPDPTYVFAGERVSVVSDPRGGTSYVFPPARHKGIALGLTLFAAVWWGIVFALFQGGAPWFFKLTFGGAGIFLAIGVFATWLHTRKIRVSSQGVGLSSGLGIRGGERRFAFAEIEAVAVDSDMQVGNEMYHHVALKLKEGKTKKASGSMRSRRATELLADAIRQQAEEAGATLG